MLTAANYKVACVVLIKKEQNQKAETAFDSLRLCCDFQKVDAVVGHHQQGRQFAWHAEFDS